MTGAAGDADRLSVDTATGTEVHLPVAGLGARAYAFVIDLHLRAALALVWWLAAGMLVSGTLDPREIGDDADGEAYLWLVLLPATAIWLLYHPIVEIAMRGRTPGKRWAGVRVAALDGAPPGAGALLIRNAFRVLDALPVAYCVGLVACLVTRRQVRVGDLAAGTLLVYAERKVLADEFAVAKHAPLGHGALAADLLARWQQLERAQRLALGRRLLERLGVPGAATLDDAAVVAQLREHSRD